MEKISFFLPFRLQNLQTRAVTNCTHHDKNKKNVCKHPAIFFLTCKTWKTFSIHYHLLGCDRLPVLAAMGLTTLTSTGEGVWHITNSNRRSSAGTTPRVNSTTPTPFTLNWQGFQTLAQEDPPRTTTHVSFNRSTNSIIIYNFCVNSFKLHNFSSPIWN